MFFSINGSNDKARKDKFYFRICFLCFDKVGNKKYSAQSDEFQDLMDNIKEKYPYLDTDAFI